MVFPLEKMETNDIKSDNLPIAMDTMDSHGFLQWIPIDITMGMMYFPSINKKSRRKTCRESLTEIPNWRHLGKLLQSLHDSEMTCTYMLYTCEC